jgi:hypothetical protein
LWLVTLAKDHPLTFVDHALQHGDSLVGLSRRQIEAFHWDTSSGQLPLVADKIRPQMQRLSALRREIREADDDVTDAALANVWHEARAVRDAVRLIGDLAVAAFFEGESAKERAAKRAEFADAVEKGHANRYLGWTEERRITDPPLAPLHWEIEFPEVFERDNPGFDSIVGNPPYSGVVALGRSHHRNYTEYLRILFEGAGGKCDLIAYFFRQAYTILRERGTLGLVATNTIRQGDTRTSGLARICAAGGVIYNARRRVVWPGQAAVHISVVHVAKNMRVNDRILDGRRATTITAYLFSRGSSAEPATLAASLGLCFSGIDIRGNGFTFDDGDPSASPIEEMRRVVLKSPRNAERIFPYIGGEDINTSPIHESRRFVIHLSGMTENEAGAWPDLLAICHDRVRPHRLAMQAQSDAARLKERWWWFGHQSKELYEAIRHRARVLACSQTSKYLSFAFLPARSVFSHKTRIVALDTFSAFSVLQSRVHQEWAYFRGSTMKDDPVYVPSDCFETFPFPANWTAASSLEVAGNKYYELRASSMIEKQEGLTKIYNRFHDPEERDPEIMKLRELHAAMDRAVLDAYGWRDFDPKCEFLLDYEIDEDEWGDKKKPWRYRWSDEVRDEVLARLLELNAQRAKQEAEAGRATRRRSAQTKDSGSSPRGPDTGSLF